jgi:hypothetical protein
MYIFKTHLDVDGERLDSRGRRSGAAFNLASTQQECKIANRIPRYSKFSLVEMGRKSEFYNTPISVLLMNGGCSCSGFAPWVASIPTC